MIYAIYIFCFALLPLFMIYIGIKLQTLKKEVKELSARMSIFEQARNRLMQHEKGPQ